jgi:hypothetical protein
MDVADYAVVPVVRQRGELHGADPWMFRSLGAAVRAAERCRDRYVGVMVVALYGDRAGAPDQLVLLGGHGTIPRSVPPAH